jgi:hypothetical protein
MIKTNPEKLKRQIVATVHRNGLPTRTQNISDRLALPDDIVLNYLLTELIAEGRLIRGYTLLVNGDKGDTFDQS